MSLSFGSSPRRLGSSFFGIESEPLMWPCSYCAFGRTSMMTASPPSAAYRASATEMRRTPSPGVEVGCGVAPLVVGGDEIVGGPELAGTPAELARSAPARSPDLHAAPKASAAAHESASAVAV